MNRHLLTGAALAAVLACAAHTQAAAVSFEYTGTLASYTVPANGDHRITAYVAPVS
jgi:hypothetical protein